MTKMNNPKKFAARCVVYLMGQLVLAFAVNLSINSNLGISPNSSLPYVLSLVLNTKMSTCIMGISIIQLLLQAVLLRREFKWINVAQFGVSALFGYCVDFTRWILGDFALTSYWGRMGMLLTSILLIGVGISLYVDASLLPAPSEGLTLAFSKACKVKFHNAKNIQDITTVSLALLLGYINMGSLVGVGEGTILSALLVGRAVKLVQKWIKPQVDKVCF